MRRALTVAGLSVGLGLPGPAAADAAWDVNQNGVGVAPLPVQQRTQVGSFSGASCNL